MIEKYHEELQIHDYLTNLQSYSKFIVYEVKHNHTQTCIIII